MIEKPSNNVVKHRPRGPPINQRSFPLKEIPQSFCRATGDIDLANNQSRRKGITTSSTSSTSSASNASSTSCTSSTSTSSTSSACSAGSTSATSSSSSASSSARSTSSSSSSSSSSGSPQVQLQGLPEPSSQFSYFSVRFHTFSNLIQPSSTLFSILVHTFPYFPLLSLTFPYFLKPSLTFSNLF